MTNRLNVPERGDVLQLRDLRDAFESPAVKHLLSRIDRMIEAERSACESAEGLKELRRAQGALKALRTVRSLPDILMREMRKP